MDDSNNTSPQTGGQQNRTSDQSTSSRLIPNETTMRAGDRTCAQKLSIPTLEKHDSSSANLWWRKFVQYTKMTRDIGFVNHDQFKRGTATIRHLELEIKDTFQRATGQSALTEMTRTVRAGIQCLTVIQTVHFIPFAFYPRKECTTQPGRFLRPKAKPTKQPRTYGKGSLTSNRIANSRQ